MRLPRGQNTSVRGGTYELTEHGAHGVRAKPVVQEVPEFRLNPEPVDGTLWGRNGLTLKQAAAMADDQLLSLPGIGRATVERIRRLTQEGYDEREEG
jgi:hypothetical protein